MERLSWNNHFGFLVPPLIWNVLFTSKLPLHAFDQEAPGWLLFMETIFRVAAMVYPLLLPIRKERSLFLPGLAVYLLGLLLYFAAWSYLMLELNTIFSRFPLLQFAPAYLPLLWFSGIAIMAGSYRYFSVSCLFIGLHVGEYLFRYAPGSI